MPALLYAGTVLLYVFVGRRRAGAAGTTSRSAEWEIPVIAGALIWLAYELIILIGPAEFRDAQYYVLGALGLGLVFYMVQMVTEPGRCGPSRARARSSRSERILAIDQGTSATKAVLVGPGGKCSAAPRCRSGYAQRGRATGWRRTRRSCSPRWSRPGRRRWPRPGAGATRSRWPTRARPCWPGTGRPAAPLTPAIVWQDRRSAGVCERLAGPRPPS